MDAQLRMYIATMLMVFVAIPIMFTLYIWYGTAAFVSALVVFISGYIAYGVKWVKDVEDFLWNELGK